MNGSIIEIITAAIAAARQAGLDSGDERVAARAVLMARDPTLSAGVARLLVDELHHLVMIEAPAAA